MSIYTECQEAARLLLDVPALRKTAANCEGQEPLWFTELDVITLASDTAGGYSAEQMTEARRSASQAVGMLYRSGDAARFGPVYLPGLIKPDYVRANSKIVYGNPDGPQEIRTPNGVFDLLLAENDDRVVSQGRRLGTNRDDFIPWDEQQAIEELKNRVDPADLQEIAILRKLNSDKDMIIMRLEARLAAYERLNAAAITESMDIVEHPNRDGVGTAMSEN